MYCTCKFSELFMQFLIVYGNYYAMSKFGESILHDNMR